MQIVMANSSKNIIFKCLQIVVVFDLSKLLFTCAEQTCNDRAARVVFQTFATRLLTQIVVMNQIFLRQVMKNLLKIKLKSNKTGMYACI